MPARWSTKSAIEVEAIRRLFDEARDPDALIEAGDWCPGIGGRRC
jgi:hypothetical protein